MAQWLPGSNDSVIYNKMRNKKLVSCIVNIVTKKERLLPMPVQAVDANGKEALVINYRRLYKLRRDYGYRQHAVNFSSGQADDNDGIWKMDLKT